MVWSLRNNSIDFASLIQSAACGNGKSDDENALIVAPHWTAGVEEHALRNLSASCCTQSWSSDSIKAHFKINVIRHHEAHNVEHHKEHFMRKKTPRKKTTAKACTEKNTRGDKQYSSNGYVRCMRIAEQNGTVFRHSFLGRWCFYFLRRQYKTKITRNKVRLTLSVFARYFILICFIDARQRNGTRKIRQGKCSLHRTTCEKANNSLFSPLYSLVIVVVVVRLFLCTPFCAVRYVSFIWDAHCCLSPYSKWFMVLLYRKNAVIRFGLQHWACILEMGFHSLFRHCFGFHCLK